MALEIPFGPHGPFDADERRVIVDLVDSVRVSGRAQDIIDAVAALVARLERLGALIDSMPSLFRSQSLGSRQRDLSSLVEMLSRSNLSNFDMFVPTRALLGRDLVMAEVNFYRLLRLACDEALAEPERARHRAEVDRLLCACLYSRLVEEVLKHIASDPTVAQETRGKAVLALAQLWERNAYRISDFFPVLEAAWEARRHVPATLGTLMGTAEMFGLLREGCDPAFVEYLGRPDHTEEEGDAFREFLFGALTEKLKVVQQQMTESGMRCIKRTDSAVRGLVCDAAVEDQTDPASAMFEFFLTRHLQAAARRLADLPGPKRTAEEYVILHYLENLDSAEIDTTGLESTLPDAELEPLGPIRKRDAG